METFEKPNVYLAGKIRKNDWRKKYSQRVDSWGAATIDGLLAGGTAMDNGKMFHSYPVDNGEWTNVGPFFIDVSDAHGQAFGENSHGVMGEYVAAHHYCNTLDMMGLGDTSSLSKVWTFRNCISAIHSCDILFAWVDTLDCFGTISEIGYAGGMTWADGQGGSPNCKILIAGPERFSDLWFAYEYADEVNFSFENPSDALNYYLNKYTAAPKLTYRDYLKTTKWKSKAKAAKDAAGNACQVCNASGVQLDTHHRTYDNLGDEKAGDLVVLCRDCHSIFHKAKKVKGQW